MRHIEQKKTKFPDTVIRFALCVAFFLCATVFDGAAFGTSDKTMIFFYSSETNINNFKSLKMEFDTFLSNLGPYEFQPFSDRSTFENHIRDKKKCLLILSSWHYTNIYEAYGLKAVFTGVREGKNSQKRIWVGKVGSDIASAKAGQIASASSVQHTRSVLSEILGTKDGTDKLKILTVPKDIDALMSVGFGMSKSALTTANAMNSLKNINPALHKKMTVLVEGGESLLLVLAVPEAFGRNAEKPMNIIAQMAETPRGEERIRMLGLDQWQKIGASARTILEGK